MPLALRWGGGHFVDKAVFSSMAAQLPFETLSLKALTALYEVLCAEIVLIHISRHG